MKRVACFAHARRKFLDRQKLATKEVNKLVKIIAKLYAVEKKYKLSTPEERLNGREKYSKPILNTLKEYLEFLREELLPKHALQESISYMLNNWNDFFRYTENGNLKIDNNLMENKIRPIAIGRKNWLFAGSEEGAQRAAIIYSILATCKLQKINAFHYLQ